MAYAAPNVFDFWNTPDDSEDAPPPRRIKLYPPSDVNGPVAPEPPPLDMATLMARDTPSPVYNGVTLGAPAMPDAGDVGRPALSPYAQQGFGAGDTPPPSKLALTPSPIDDNIPPYIAETSNAKLDTTPAPHVIAPLPTDPVARQKEILSRLSDKTNPDYTLTPQKHGFKARLLEGLREAAIGAGQQWNQSRNPDPRMRLGEAIGGAFGGAAIGGINPTINNQRIRLRDTAQAKADLQTAIEQAKEEAQTADILDKPAAREAATQQKIAQQQAITQRQITAFQNRMKIHAQDADVKAGKAKLTTDANGLVWKEFLQADSKGHIRPKEAAVNPTTGEQDFDPGEQMVDWKDPNTGTVMKVKAKQTVMPSATMAAGNAQRQQQGDEFNIKTKAQIDEANNKAEIEWNKENTKAENDVNNRNATRMIDIAKAGVTSDTQGPYQQMVAAKDRMQAALDDGGEDAAANPKANAAYLKAQKEFWDSHKVFQDALTKQANGQQVVQAMQKGMEGKPARTPRPAKLPYPDAVKPAQVSGGSVPSVKVSEDEFSQGLKRHNVPVEQWPARIAKAKADGVIR